MPRRFPWEIKPEPDARSSTRGRTAKSLSLTASGSESGSRNGTPKQPGRKRPRSPSTSPIREEPPEEQFMIEGYDDLYIMVEDEFLTTAKMFTRHLHRQEYERRKSLAKSRVDDLARPIDPRAKMSMERKKHIEAKAVSAKQKAALDRIKDGAGRPQVDSEIDDPGEGSDADRPDDPWVGTQLAALMMSPRRKRSLVGLQGVKSTTRAAMGYSKSNPRRETPQSPRAAARSHTAFQRPRSSRQDEPEASSEEDDDLGSRPKPAASKLQGNGPKGPTLATISSSSTPRTDIGSTVGSTATSKSSPGRPGVANKPRPPTTAAVEAGTKSTYKSRIGRLFDDSEEESVTAMPAGRPKSALPEKEPDKGSSALPPKATKRPDGKSRYDQIPTFL